MRLREANAVLAEQVIEAMNGRDAAEADSLVAATRVGYYREHHAALLEACTGVLDAIFPMGVGIEDLLREVPVWLT